MTKTGAIKDIPTPDNVTTLQSFLALANYYQSFIKNLHDLRAPLNEQLKKDKQWRWTPECQTAFDQIKKALTSDLSSRTMTQNWRLLSQVMPAHMRLVCVSNIKCPMG